VTGVESCRVLLVDDEADYLATLVKRLSRRGIGARAVHSGAAALARLREEPADVVVLDVKMPGMDGIATLQEIKRHHPLVEVIMLTGHVDVEVAIHGMEVGAFDYLMKPTDIDELLFKIQDAHRKKSIQQAKIDSVQKSIEPVE
jgi:DNA-binding NtrC family response regulator